MNLYKKYILQAASGLIFSAVILVNIGCGDSFESFVNDSEASYVILNDTSIPYDTIHVFQGVLTTMNKLYYYQDYVSQNPDNYLIKGDTNFYRTPSYIIDYPDFFRWGTLPLTIDLGLAAEAAHNAIDDTLRRIAVLNEVQNDVFLGYNLQKNNVLLGYNQGTKALEMFYYSGTIETFFFDAAYDSEGGTGEGGNHENVTEETLTITLIKELASANTRVILDSITFSEHALWSKGDPYMDSEKTWEITEITDSAGNILNSAAYDCLYDNTFTFYPGNQLKLDLGAIYCPSLDQPLLDLGQDFAYQQYVVVDEPGQTNPYVLITTPGGLFAPQRMYMMNFDQEDASLSTKYGSDSINMKVKAL